MEDGAVDLGIPGLTDAVEVARGGFSTVFRARQRAMERTVAVKLIHATVVDPVAGEHFLREVRATGRLSQHPNVAPVYDVGTTATGQPYLIMPYYERGSLEQRLTSRGALSEGGVRPAGPHPRHHARVRPPARDPPPRHQAGQRPAHRVRRAAAGRLRGGPAGRRVGPRPHDGRQRGHVGLRSAGGLHRRRADGGLGHLLPRRHRLRHAHRAATVRRRRGRQRLHGAQPHRQRRGARPARPRRSRRPSPMRSARPWPRTPRTVRPPRPSSRPCSPARSRPLASNRSPRPRSNRSAEPVAASRSPSWRSRPTRRSRPTSRRPRGPLAAGSGHRTPTSRPVRADRGDPSRSQSRPSRTREPSSSRAGAGAGWPTGPSPSRTSSPSREPAPAAVAPVAAAAATVGAGQAAPRGSGRRPIVLGVLVAAAALLSFLAIRRNLYEGYGSVLDDSFLADVGAWAPTVALVVGVVLLWRRTGVGAEWIIGAGAAFVLLNYGGLVDFLRREDNLAGHDRHGDADHRRRADGRSPSSSRGAWPRFPDPASTSSWAWSSSSRPSSPSPGPATTAITWTSRSAAG